MPAFKIAVINEASVAQADVEAFVAGASVWVTDKLAPFWPEIAGTTIRSIAAGGSSGSDEAQLVIAPNTTLANSLGYHNWTPGGLPTAIVEMDACIAHNQPWTIPGTHEIGEMLINPQLAGYIYVGNLAYPKEICDPVTSDRMEIGGILAANAVTPAWFNQMAPANSQFDLLGNVHAPIPQIPKGGWVEWWDGSGWQNAWGAEMAPDMLAYMNARQGRRFSMRLGHESWSFGTARAEA